MLKTLGAQVKQYRWVTFITPVFSALEAVADMFLPMLMSRIIDKGVKVGGQAGMQAVLHYGAIMVAVAIGALVCGILAGRFASIASTGFAANLRQAMFANIQSFSFSNIDRFSTAGLVTRLTTDVSNVQLSYQMITRICVRAPVMLITALIMAFSIHASLSMIFVVAIVILAAALSFIIFKATGTFNRVFKKYDDLNASVQENVGAIRVVKAFVREDYERSKFNKAANAVYRMFVKAETYVSFNNPVMMLTVFGSMLGLSWLGAKAIVLEGFTEGGLMSLFSYVMSILMSLMMISMIFVMMSMSVASARRICEVLAGEGAGHTFVLHAKDEAVVRRFALTVPVSRFLVNVPASLGGIGAETALFPALTLGCGAVGGSSSSNNIGPLDLINLRRVAWGSEKPEPQPETPDQPEPDSALIARLTEEILKKLR